MKKLSISIKSPCHESWDEMLPFEKGKFCRSCQKTVVDFTAMSDRQLADFFKQPRANLCGHFHADQLERDLVINKKRIPWVRYFFQFTWPAMVLLLKSCGTKQSWKEQHPTAIFPSTISNKKIVSTSMIETVAGEVLPVPPPRVKVNGFFMCPVVKGDVEIVYDDAIQGEILEEIPSKKSMKKSFTRSLDCHVNKESLLHHDVRDGLPKVVKKPVELFRAPGMNTYKMGGIGIGSNINPSAKKELPPVAPSSQISKEFSDNELLVFPNPVKVGSTLKVTFPLSYDIQDYKVFDAAGKVVVSKQNASENGSTECSITIPGHLSAGIYFLKMTGRGKTMLVKKIIIE